MFSDLLLQPNPDKPGVFVVVETFAWHHDALPGGVYIVPEGTETDLASIPVGLRNLFNRTGRSIYAAVPHDHMYGQRWESRKICDDMLRIGLIDAGMSSWKARIYWLGVRAGGWTRGNW